MREQSVKVGDLVGWTCPETDADLFGLVTDLLEDDWGRYMYELECPDPYNSGWYHDVLLKVINASQ